MSRKIILPKNQLDEIERWSERGKPSTFNDPSSLEFFPKFSLVYKKIKERNLRHILDIGCYTGFLIRKLQEEGRKCVGVDVQKDLMEDLNEKYTPDFYFLTADQVNKKFGKEFDCVMLLDVLEHIIDDEKAISAIEEVLIPNGWVFIHLPRNEDYPDFSGEHVRNYDDNDIKLLFGNKKNFSFEFCQDEFGRETSFIEYQV